MTITQDTDGAARRLAIVDDALFLAHAAPGPHPERPERLDALRAGLASAHLSLPTVQLPARDATDDELVRVHAASYLERLGREDRALGGDPAAFAHLDADTFLNGKSIAAARRAAGGSLALVDSLLGGAASLGVALLRPPGHHATRARGMGFCLINNVAVAAAHARAAGVERVAIVDWDVHHGNGTQDIFEDDPSVLVLSLHQFPFYPGSGSVAEQGRGDGRGTTANIPLVAGADPAVYHAAFARIVAPILAAFSPGLLLVSAGFDAHRRDPLGGMALTDDAYGAFFTALVDACPGLLPGRIGLFLEGGYDLPALSGSLGAVVQTAEAHLQGDPVDRDAVGRTPALPAHREDELARVRKALATHWKL